MSTIKYKNSGGYQNLCATAVLPRKKKKEKRKKEKEKERLKSNVFRTGPVIEPEKLPVHGSPVGPAVEPLLNR